MKMLKSIALAGTLAVACMELLGCSKKTLAQKEQVTIVAVYQVPGGAFETCLRHDDGTLSLWTNHKLGAEGDKIFIWRDGGTEWLQDPK